MSFLCLDRLHALLRSLLSFSMLHLRWGLQVAAAVAAIQAVFSTRVIFDTYSLPSSSTATPQANATLSGLTPLIPTLRFEWHPLEHPHRLAPDAAFRAQRLCRHCLNVLSAFATSMDAHHIQRVDLLAQHQAQVSRLSRQLGESLRCLRAVVQGRAPPSSMVSSVTSLHAHTERLFLLVLLRDLPGVGGSAQGAQGAAFLAMLFSLAWVVRRLALALARTFWGADAPQVQALAVELEDEQRWQVDEQLLSAAQAVLGLANAAGAGGSEDEEGGGGADTPAT